jgi:prepilin-type N-terminal cleavage/methylation domain-containing protein
VSGVTLIEVMITLAIMVVLLGVVVPSMARMLERQRVQGAAEQAVMDLHQARSESLSRQESVFLSTSVASGTGSCYVISVGNRGGCRCNSDGIATCDADSAALKTVGFPANHPVQLLESPASTVVIDSLRGLSTSTGTYRFGSPDGLRMKLVMSRRQVWMCEMGKPGCD